MGNRSNSTQRRQCFTHPGIAITLTVHSNNEANNLRFRIWLAGDTGETHREDLPNNEEAPGAVLLSNHRSVTNNQCV